MLLPTKQNISTVTDMRVSTLKLLNEVENSGFRFIFQRSTPRAVILSIPQYQSILDRLENKEDEMYAREIENLPKGRGVDLKDIAKEYEVKL